MQGPLPTEIVVLAWSVVLLAIHLALQSGLATLESGLAYNASSRDAGTQPQGVVAGRAKRALANFLETYPAFLALALALTATGRAGGMGADGAWIWLVSRALYVPLYLAGIPYIRSLAFAGSVWGLVRMFEQLMT